MGELGKALVLQVELAKGYRIVMSGAKPCQTLLTLSVSMTFV